MRGYGTVRNFYFGFRGGLSAWAWRFWCNRQQGQQTADTTVIAGTQTEIFFTAISSSSDKADVFGMSEEYFSSLFFVHVEDRERVTRSPMSTGREH